MGTCEPIPTVQPVKEDYRPHLLLIAVALVAVVGFLSMIFGLLVLYIFIG